MLNPSPEAAKYTKSHEVRGLRVCFPWLFQANPENHLKRLEVLESPRKTDFQTPNFVGFSVFSSLRVTTI